MQKNTSQAIYNSDVFLIQSRIMVCICRNIKYIKKKKSAHHGSWSENVKAQSWKT